MAIIGTYMYFRNIIFLNWKINIQKVKIKFEVFKIEETGILFYFFWEIIDQFHKLLFKSTICDQFTIKECDYEYGHRL